jgi:hypothetical protein
VLDRLGVQLAVAVPADVAGVGFEHLLYEVHDCRP